MLTGHGSETDQDAVGAAVTTIAYNMPEMVKSVQIISALMDNDGLNGKDLLAQTQQLCNSFSDLFEAVEPNKPRQDVYTAAKKVGTRSKRVLYTIEEEEVTDTNHQGVLNDLVGVVAAATAKMVETLKDIAGACEDQDARSQVKTYYCSKYIN